MMKQGFTLIEVAIVIIIISILATLGFIEYQYVMESFRKSEAKTSLGQLRKAEVAYFQDRQKYSGIQDLGLDLPISPTCNSKYYFCYSCDSANGTCWADRCVSGGKSPNVNARQTYRIYLGIGGDFSQTGYGVS